MTPDGEVLSPARKAELRAAGLKVGAAVVVGAGLFALYAHEVKVEQQVQDLLAGVKIAGGRAGGARAELNRDTPRGWLAAEDALQKALALQPSNPYAVAAMADDQVLLSGAGFADRAPRAEDAVARAEAKDVALPERYEARALQLIAQGKAGEAETFLLALLEKFGGVPRMIDALGRAQRASGKLADARANFKKAQEADWRAPRFVADYAQALLEDGNALEASQAFDRALQANSDHLRSQLGKARALIALTLLGRGSGDLKVARALCDAVLAKGPPELPVPLKAQALAVRGEARLAEGDLAAAAKDAAAALQAEAKSPAALRARALLATAKKGAEAGAAFKAALAADPYDASTYFDGAAALAAAGDAAAAEKLLGAYAATLPRSARYHLALAQVLSRRGASKDAQAELAKAQQLEPTNALVWFEQGRVLQAQKDAKAAAAAYERAAQLRDDFPEVYRQMGGLYLESRNVDAALKVFNEALARYKAARTPPAVMEAFYSEVVAQVSRAGKKKLALAWVKEARALH
jgi:tetratricopeptide (TPR) repeat protein